MSEYTTGAVAIGMFILFLIFVMWAQPTSAHEHDGMVYDSWCCNNKDCAPADVKFLDNGQLQATTKHGTALFDLRTMPKFRIKPSTDGRYHACIAAKKGRCIYLPAGI